MGPSRLPLAYSVLLCRRRVVGRWTRSVPETVNQSDSWLQDVQLCHCLASDSFF